MRINKLLSNYGYCSRKEANRIIEDGRVFVNGVKCIPGQWVEEEDYIVLDNIKVQPKKNIYIILNKPKGITCTADSNVKENIIDYINFPEYIFPVGRLDKDSQGLILLTNDGELSNKIIGLHNEKEKEYIVTVDKELNEDFIFNLSNGVDIDGVITKKCNVYMIDKNTFNIVLTQGLNRQIRKMCKKFGYNVIKLERIRIVNLEIGNLEYGMWRYLNSSEIIDLKNKLK